VDTKTGADHI